MPLFSNNTQKITIDSYTVVYSINSSLTAIEPDCRIPEYGISCVAYNADGTISSADEVRCISPLFYKVLVILGILRDHQVFPLHLRDVVSDLIDELPMEHPIDLYPMSA